jgi:tetratricopeptide (TPR) repeat protein
MVAFGSATEALNCAVSMQQGVTNLSRTTAINLRIRVGLSGGEASVEDDDYFGDPVVEASRLCAASKPSQILSAKVVQLTAGRRSAHDWRDIGGLELKGIPHLVDTVEVLWTPLDAGDTTHVPLPERLLLAPEAGLVGRRENLEEIAAALIRIEETRQNEVLFVAGEAGVGKTSLLCEAARAAYEGGATVLYGHCEEDVRAPYQLFIESLNHLIAHAAESDLIEHVERNGVAVTTIAPVLASRIRSDATPSAMAGATEGERYVLFSAVVDLLSREASNHTLVIVFEDLQWADSASLSLLRHIVLSDHLGRMLILGSYRDNELANSPELLETLSVFRRLQRFRRIEMDGLASDEVVSLMAGLTHHELRGEDVTLARSIARETDGNPFFAQEVIRHIRDSRADVTGTSAGAGVIDLPDSVREVIGARVRRLGDATHRVLSTAAVIGRDFDFPLLRATTGVDADELVAMLERAEALSLVHESQATGGFRFAHALFQHTLYEDLGATRRALTHRKVAEALEQLVQSSPDPRYAERARHWSHTGDPSDAPIAVFHLRRAAEAAFESLAPTEALRYYRQILDLTRANALLDRLDQLDVMIGYGTALQQSADQSYRQVLLDAANEAIELDDTDRLVAALLANDRGWMGQAGVLDTAKVEVLEAALERLERGPNRALILAKLCAEYTFHRDLDRRLRLADEAFEIALECDDKSIYPRVSKNIFYSILLPESVETSLVRTAEALTRAETVNDEFLLLSTLLIRMVDLARIGDIEGVDQCLARVRPIVDHLGQPTSRWAVGLNECWRALIAGDVALAEHWANQTFAFGSESQEPDAAIFYGVQLSMVHQQRGTLEEMLPLLEQTIKDNPQMKGFMAYAARAYAETDRLEQAQGRLNELAERNYHTMRNVEWLTAVSNYAEAAYQCRDADAAQALYDQLSDYDSLMVTVGGTTASGPTAHFLGQLATVLGQYDAAESHFERSSAISAPYGLHFFLAATELSWAKMLVQRAGPADHDRAREMLERVRAVSTARGYGTLRRRAIATLERLG